MKKLAFFAFVYFLTINLSFGQTKQIKPQNISANPTTTIRQNRRLGVPPKTNKLTILKIDLRTARTQ